MGRDIVKAAVILVERQCDMHECRKPSSSVMPRDEECAWHGPTPTFQID